MNVEQLNEMRRLTRQIVDDELSLQSYPSRVAKPEEVELRLQTYVMAGLSIEALKVEADRLREEMIQDMDERQQDSNPLLDSRNPNVNRGW